MTVHAVQPNIVKQVPLESRWSQQNMIIATALSATMLAAVATAIALNAKLIQTHGIDLWKGRFAPLTLALPLSTLVLSSIAMAILVTKIESQPPKEKKIVPSSLEKVSTHPKSFVTTLLSEGESYEGLSVLSEGREFQANEILFYKEAMKMKMAFSSPFSGVIKKVNGNDGVIPSGEPVVEVLYHQQQKELAPTSGTVRYEPKFKGGVTFDKGEVYGHIVYALGKKYPLKIEWPIKINHILVSENSEIKKDQALFNFSFLSF
jgi:biotin carboxyl carrier protein